MSKADYLKYQAAVERGLRGLSHVSTGACSGCPECGLETKWQIVVPDALEREVCLYLEHSSEDEALEEIERAKADPDLAGLDLSGLTVQEVEPTEREREAAEEPSFSWSACDCCRSRLRGDRHPAHGFIHQDGADHLCHMRVCTDCLYYLNYGQLDDTTMLDMESAS